MPFEKNNSSGPTNFDYHSHHLRIDPPVTPDSPGDSKFADANGKYKTGPLIVFDIKASQADVFDCIADRETQPPRWVKPRKLIVDSLFVLCLLLDVIAAAVYLYGWFSKYGLEPPENYRYYLTNWSWTLQALYYTIKSVGLILQSKYIIFGVYMVMFWPIWIVSNAVSIMVVFVIVDNPDMLVELFHKYGASVVLGVDRMYHVIPVAVFVLDVILSLRFLIGWFWLQTRGVWIMILLQVVLAHCIVLPYMGMNDMHDVYGLHNLHWWELGLAFEGTLLLFGVLFMYALSQFRKLGGFDFNS